jgi:hypothetical protein
MKFHGEKPMLPYHHALHDVTVLIVIAVALTAFGRPFIATGFTVLGAILLLR